MAVVIVAKGAIVYRLSLILRIGISDIFYTVRIYLIVMSVIFWVDIRFSWSFMENRHLSKTGCFD